MKTQLMKPVDAAWLFMDSADTPMHIGALAIFEKPRNAPADFLSQLATRMRTTPASGAPWNMSLAAAGGSVLLPRLTEVRKVDLDYHFRHAALPAPGGEKELGIVVSALHSAALDRARPLWELHLIEGLAGDRFAFYIKIHLAVAGNVNAMPLLFSMLSSNARSRNMAPPWANPLAGYATLDTDAALNPEAPVESLASLGKAGWGILRAMANPKLSRRFLFPGNAPRSTLNRAINTQRRFATQQFEQRRIEQLAKATSSTVNEILTYLCGSSLRRFFKEYNALPDASLVGLIPVQMHESAGRGRGNAVAGIRVQLGTHIGDPLARLAKVKESIKRVRDDRSSLPEEAVTSYSLLRAAPLLASQMPAVGRFVPPIFNLGVSNTEGVDKPMYFEGARLQAVYPVSQLLQYSALSIDCVNYAGTLNIGFTGARDTLPHLQRMAVYMGQAVTDLEEVLQTVEAAA